MISLKLWDTRKKKMKSPKKLLNFSVFNSVLISHWFQQDLLPGKRAADFSFRQDYLASDWLHMIYSSCLNHRFIIFLYFAKDQRKSMAKFSPSLQRKATLTKDTWMNRSAFFHWWFSLVFCNCFLVYIAIASKGRVDGKVQYKEFTLKLLVSFVF